MPCENNKRSDQTARYTRELIKVFYGYKHHEGFFSMNQLHFIMFFHLHLSTNNSKKSSFTKSLNDINLNLQNDNLGLKSYFYRLILYTLAVFHLYFSYNYWHLSHYCLWQDMMETIQESCHKKTCPWRCAFCVDSDQPSYGHFNFFHLCVCVH